MESPERLSKKEDSLQEPGEKGVMLDAEGAEEIVSIEPRIDTEAETLPEIRSRLKRIVEEIKTLPPRSSLPAEAAPESVAETPSVEAAPIPETPAVASAPHVTMLEELSQDSAPIMPQEAMPEAAEPAPVQPEAEKPAGTVEAFMASSAWENYRGMNAREVFLNNPANMPPELQEFRKGLFELLRASGIGPKPGENLQSYIENAKRSEEAVASHPEVIRAANGTLVARGGDASARFIIAYEYLSTMDSDGRVYVESPTGISGEYVEYHSKTMNTSELAPKRLNIDTAGAQAVF